jgi:2-C-methyl-D-erythritol 2,4-cyclodiphosphate synthase
MIKIGLGYDLHALEKGRPLILGGVVIPFDKGEKGHSDGDVLLHAITDALLGAAGLSDIGELFPPSQEQWKGADSSLLLQKAWKLVTDNGWTLDNIDCVIAIEKPKILPYRKEIISRIAEILQCRDDQIFVKAKTGEKLGEIGREEAVCVWAVCLLSKE